MSTIDLDNITNEEKTGVFDKLMESVNEQIESQYSNNRITGANYATVYLGGMQAVLQQSIMFVLEEKLREAQISETIDSTIRANKDLDDKLLNSSKQRDLMDEQIESENLQQVILETEEEIKEAQKEEILDSTIRSNKDLDDKLLNSSKQRDLMDEQIESENLQQVILETEEEIKEAQKEEILDSTIRSNKDLDDKLLNSNKQRDLMDEQIESENKNQILAEQKIKESYTDRVIKDKQAAKLGLDNVMKNSETIRVNDSTFIYSPNYEENN